MRRIRRVHVLGAALAAALCVPASGVSSSAATPSILTKVGKGEGSLNLIAWEGYTDKSWVKPFVKQTGCKVRSKFAGSSDEMVTLMRTGQYDAVSASGDASLRLIIGKDVRGIDPKLVPDFKNFIPALKSPPHNTVKGVHYGISLQWGPNTLLYNTKKVKPAPKSWSVIYSSKYKGKITVPDNPIQIADVALQFEGAQNPYAIDEATAGDTVESGVIREVVYVGMFTRYIVELDSGGELTVVRQNLETSSTEALESRGRRVRLEWRPEHTFEMERPGGQA